MNPGGVTRIIEAQVKGLASFMEPADIRIACGPSENAISLTGLPVIENELLSYRESESSPVELYRDISGILSFLESNTDTKTILHCHNPNLGKNPALMLAIHNLAKKGMRVVNHCHDFPEERPSNIDLITRMIEHYSLDSADEVMYPVMANYHYIVLNSCDHQRLLKKGIPGGFVHMIHNPVSNAKKNQVTYNRAGINDKLGINPDKLLVTYPVRAIKRKNLGEFILLSVLFSDRAEFAVTLAPLNPVELPGYNRWKSFCRENNIKIAFETSQVTDYEELVQMSDFCITTSIQEGFGMTYLEPWLAGTPVIGRELDCIMHDLKSKGMQFPGLYQRIITDYNSRVSDFKDLSLQDQERFIYTIQNSKSAREKLLSSNPVLASLLDPVPESVISSNRETILQHFSIESYGKELFGIYKQIAR
jgi:glycosyltransferase involved in cell wall biosynthesis